MGSCGALALASREGHGHGTGMGDMGMGTNQDRGRGGSIVWHGEEGRELVSRGRVGAAYKIKERIIIFLWYGIRCASIRCNRGTRAGRGGPSSRSGFKSLIYQAISICTPQLLRASPRRASVRCRCTDVRVERLHTHTAIAVYPLTP